ncbi:MAG: PIG-L family deacetylase [Pseudomonadota bacterium]
MSEAEAAGTDWAETLLAHRSLLVVAPHPDDEALGCGGLIALTAAADADIAVLFTTDGGASHRGEAWPRERLADLRGREADAALAALGAGQAARCRLGLRDADMALPGSPEGDAALAATRAFLAKASPDLVVLPWRRDPHRDHRDSHALVSRALREARMAPTRLEYAIWLDELGRPEDHPRNGEMHRRALPIASVLTAKRAAIAAHVSQTTDLIDDPDGFRLTEETIARLTGPEEIYWEPAPA